MGITPYKIGDELGIERTEEFEQDWCPLISEDLLRGESYTYRDWETEKDPAGLTT